MNILMIHNYYQHRGGEDAVFETEKEELKNIGHNVIEYSKHNNEINEYTFLQKIEFLYKTFHNKNTIKNLNIIIKKNKIDIAHIHNVFPLISPVIYKFLKKNNIKIVQTLHNYRFICPNGLFYNNDNCQLCLKNSLINCIIKKCYRNSFIYSLLYSLVIKLNQNNFKKNIDAYIALTDFTKNIFIKAGYNKNKFYVKDNGIPDKKIKRKKSKGYFLFLGRISKEKGIDFLLESFLKLDKYKLKIAGDGLELKKYKKIFKNKNIEFLGFINGSTKYKLLQESQALILPSVWFENYPVSIVESFSIGIPVIASNIGGIPYIIEDGKNGLLFKPNDFNSFKEKLELINKNTKLRDRLGNYARKVFIKKMEIKNNIIKLEKIYRDILNG